MRPAGLNYNVVSDKAALLSGLLFVLAVETLSICIRSCTEIKGIQVANREIKLSQYADDTHPFLRMNSRLESTEFCRHLR